MDPGILDFPSDFSGNLPRPERVFPVCPSPHQFLATPPPTKKQEASNKREFPSAPLHPYMFCSCAWVTTILCLFSHFLEIKTQKNPCIIILWPKTPSVSTQKDSKPSPKLKPFAQAPDATCNIFWGIASPPKATQRKASGAWVSQILGWG